MLKMHRPVQKILLVLLFIYGTASLLHFIHNAEYLADYPNLPDSWTRAGVYFAWIGMTVVGVTGWVLVARNYHLLGLLLIAIYAVLGLDSLGHYIVAPLSSHTLAMNSTIFFEVTAATLVLIEVAKQMVRRMLQRGSHKYDT